MALLAPPPAARDDNPNPSPITPDPPSPENDLAALAQRRLRQSARPGEQQWWSWQRWFSSRAAAPPHIDRFPSLLSLASLNGSRRASRLASPSSGKLEAPRATTRPRPASRRIYVNTTPGPSARDRRGCIPTHPSNRIRTTKYTIVTFIPKNLFEQFHRIANIYFLALAILQVFPDFNNGGSRILPAVPIVAITALTALKDAYEDYRRSCADKALNHTPATVLVNWRNCMRGPRQSPFLRWCRTRMWELRAWVSFKRRLPAGASELTVAPSDQDLDASAPPEMVQLGVSGGLAAEGLGVELDPRSPTRVAEKEPWPQSLQQKTTATDPDAQLAIMRAGLALAPSDPTAKPALDTSRSEWGTVPWQNVHIGDFVRLSCDEGVPCDLLLVSSSHANRGCFIETKNLDGETNLKPRLAVPQLAHLDSPQKCAATPFIVETEAPTADLYSFSASVVLPPEPLAHDTLRLDAALRRRGSPDALDRVPADVENMLPRGAVLRNTDWVIGIAIATGRDTKVLLNSGHTPSKRSRIELLINPMVYMNFCMVAIMCIATCVEFRTHYARWLDSKAPFLATKTDPALTTFLNFFNALIIYQNLVPISLYITIEIIKTGLSWFIYQDFELYYAPTDTRCMPKSWNVSDDLGQIEYVFSDKTGTLTQNCMEFRRCSIGGTAYGLESNSTVTEREAASASMCAALDALGPNRFREPASPVVPFADCLLPGRLTDASSPEYRFWLLLALCHAVPTPASVESPTKDRWELSYQAPSPDEQALVATARDIGFAFVRRDDNIAVVEVFGQELRFCVLATLPFSSARKRMSVLVRNEATGETMLVCKGADNVIYERLSAISDEIADEETMALRATTLLQLDAFACDGLRTLGVAYRHVGAEELQVWLAQFRAAATALGSERAARIDVCAEAIERGLELAGATAIEDRLQEHVPASISTLRNAGIKVWVLTGDKVETAINIGVTCNLISPQMRLTVLRGSVAAQIRDGIFRALEELPRPLTAGAGASEPSVANLRSMLLARRSTDVSIEATHGVVVDGEALRVVLGDKLLRSAFLVLATQSNSVLCCRVSPKQKAQVVRLVKKTMRAMCLAVGDGANDVGMIHEAHVGVGISGQEGLQAAMSSDFAVARFFHIVRLIMVHGRWSYTRLSQTIMLFWYKNIVWVLAQFWYQVFTGFTASLLYDLTLMMFYNLFFTTLPSFAIGFFDQDVTQDLVLLMPQLHRSGLEQTLFTYGRFGVFVVDSLYQSLVVYFVSYLAISDTVAPNGRSIDYSTYGCIVAVIAMIVVNAFHWLHLRYWAWIPAVLFFLSFAAIVLYLPIYSAFPTSTLYRVGVDFFAIPQFWLCLLLTLVVCFVPNVTFKLAATVFRPTDVDIVREMQALGIAPKAKDAGLETVSGVAAAIHNQTGMLKRRLSVSSPHQLLTLMSGSQSNTQGLRHVRSLSRARRGSAASSIAPAVCASPVGASLHDGDNAPELVNLPETAELPPRADRSNSVLSEALLVGLSLDQSNVFFRSLREGADRPALVLPTNPRFHDPHPSLGESGRHELVPPAHSRRGVSFDETRGHVTSRPSTARANSSLFSGASPRSADS